MVIVFLAVTALSVVSSVNLSRSLQLSLALLPAAMLFLLIAERLDCRHVVWVFQTLLVIGSVLCWLLLWQAWIDNDGNPTLWIKNLGTPLLRVPNDTLFIALIAPLSLILFLRNPKSLCGVLAGLYVFLSLVVVIVYQSRLALMSVIIAFALIARSLGITRKWLWAGAVIGLTVVGVDSLMGFALLAKFNTFWLHRMPLWQAAWNLFADSPWLGHGPGSYLLLYQNALTKSELQLLQGFDHRTAPWAHNIFLEVLAEQGIIGFCSLSVLLGMGAIGAWRNQISSTGEYRLLNIGVFAAFIAFCTGTFFELSLWRQWVPIFLFILLGIIALKPEARNLKNF